MLNKILAIFSCIIIIIVPFTRADWESWWTYEGISGPDFWGRLNPKWSHCSKGQRQSPIDIDTSKLLYDPYLEPIKITGDYIRGHLINTGRGISFMIDNNNHHHQQQQQHAHHHHQNSIKQSTSQTLSSLTNDKHVIISDGPFSYQYTISNITLHFGRENDRGSEHTIDGKRFPGELQLYAYNSQLYSNWSEAKREPNGLIAISIFIVVINGHPQQQQTQQQQQQHQNQPHSSQQSQQQQQSNAGLKLITNLLKNITKRGLSYPIESLSILDLLPSSWKHYITYEGSLTQPSCYETVQWVILNNPIYLSSYQFHMLRHSLKGDGHQDNFRPTQQQNKRLLRCNIINDNYKIINDNNNNNNHKRTKRNVKNSNNNKMNKLTNQQQNKFVHHVKRQIMNHFDDYYMENNNNQNNIDYNDKDEKRTNNSNNIMDNKINLNDQIDYKNYFANMNLELNLNNEIFEKNHNHSNDKRIKLKRNKDDHNDINDDDDDDRIDYVHNDVNLDPNKNGIKVSLINSNNFNNDFEPNNDNFNYDLNDNIDDNDQHRQHQFHRPNLLSIKDVKYCLPDQIRLYGYKANTKIFSDEF